MTQYLDSSKLKDLDTKAEIVLQSTDSYHESKILTKVKTMEIDKLYAIGLHVAIMGVGNKNYGEVKINNEIMDIKSYMQKKNIKFDSTLNTKLEDDDLTPRRLARLFRHQIRNHLSQNPSQQSYLHRKYVDIKDQTEQTRINVFQGAEHLLDPSKDLPIAKILMKAYKKLDIDITEKTQKKVSISDRVIRVLNARGFSSKDLIE
jgi:hypothetical protein